MAGTQVGGLPLSILPVWYNLIKAEVPNISIVTGFTRGLKHNQLKRIEKLGSRRVPADSIVSPELARQMTEISHETGRQVGVLINRKGQVEYVMVGTAKQIELPDFGRARVSEDRFRGLRCIHTHLLGEKLTQDDLTDLALLRLDLMSIIQVDRSDGLPGLVYSAHLLPMSEPPVVASGSIDSSATDERDDLLAKSQSSDGSVQPAARAGGSDKSFGFLEPAIPAHLDTDFSSLINSLEEEMARVRMTARARVPGRDRAILVGVTTGDVDEEKE